MCYGPTTRGIEDKVGNSRLCASNERLYVLYIYANVLYRSVWLSSVYFRSFASCFFLFACVVDRLVCSFLDAFILLFFAPWRMRLYALIIKHGQHVTFSQSSSPRIDLKVVNSKQYEPSRILKRCSKETLSYLYICAVFQNDVRFPQGPYYDGKLSSSFFLCWWVAFCDFRVTVSQNESVF